MKQRLYLLAFFAFSLALTSCKKGDDEPAPIPEVVGKWKVDYGLLVSGFSNDPQDFFVNGEKIDPGSAFLLDLGFVPGFPVSTIHVIEDNKVFVNVTKHLLWVDSFTGKWDYTTPTLTLKYDDSSISDEAYTYEIKDGLEQLSINETLTDSIGNPAGQIQWVYHK